MQESRFGADLWAQGTTYLGCTAVAAAMRPHIKLLWLVVSLGASPSSPASCLLFSLVFTCPILAVKWPTPTQICLIGPASGALCQNTFGVFRHEKLSFDNSFEFILRISKWRIRAASHAPAARTQHLRNPKNNNSNDNNKKTRRKLRIIYRAAINTL